MAHVQLDIVIDGHLNLDWRQVFHSRYVASLFRKHAHIDSFRTCVVPNRYAVVPTKLIHQLFGNVLRRRCLQLRTIFGRADFEELVVIKHILLVDN